MLECRFKDDFISEAAFVLYLRKLLKFSIILNILGNEYNILNEQECIENDLENNSEEADITVPLIDIYLNPEKNKGVQRIVTLKKQQLNEYFKNPNMEIFYPNLFKVLWFGSLPCSSEGGQERFMLKECKVGNERMNCSDVFQKVPTDSGMCCALNVKNALKESIYTNLVADMQSRDNAGENMKILKAKPGKRNGIKLTVDLHSDFQAAGSVYDEYEAFKVFVGDASEFPNMKDYGVSIQPGHEHFLSISNTILRADSDIKEVQPKKRNCYFPEEVNLELYKFYSYSNCMFECSMKSAENLLGCLPWYLPSLANSTLCDPWTARNFSDMMGDVDKDQCDQCLPDCQNDRISVRHTAVKFG